MKQYTRYDLQAIYEKPSKALTDRIHQEISSLLVQKQEEKAMKKRLSYRIAGTIAVLVTLTAIAYAANEIHQWIRINWNGDSVSVSEEANNNPVDPEDITVLRKMLDKMYTLMKDAPENVYATIESENGSETTKPRTKSIDSSSSLPGSVFAVPANLPEDDSLIMNLELGCTPEGEYRLIDQKTADEYTLKLYAVDPAYDAVTGYEISCLNGETVNRTIHSHLVVSAFNQFGFRTEDDFTAEPVSVPGMEKAVFVHNSEKPRVIMIRKLDSPIRVKTPPLAYNPEEKNETTEYCYELIIVHGFSPEECIDLFSHRMQ